MAFSPFVVFCKCIVAQHARIVQLSNVGQIRYSAVMTKLLDKALKAVRLLPSSSQDEIARAMLELANESEPEPIDAEHLSAILEGLSQAKGRDFATPTQVEEAFRRFDR
jgi:hypothetical protein